MKSPVIFAPLFAALVLAGGPWAARAQAISTSGARPAAVAIFAGQSNEVSHGTDQSTYGFAGVPGGSGNAGINAVASCYETTATPAGASAGSGVLTCAAPTSGKIFAGQVITAPGVPTGQVVSAANNNGNFPGATGAGSNAGGTYVVIPAASVGSPSSRVTMTFAEPDIGGSGVLNPQCQIWVPGSKTGSGSWQTYAPKVNSDYNGGGQTKSWGPEGPFCARWAADNPGQTLYMIKVGIGGSSLCELPSGNNYSPEFAGSSGIGGFGLLQSQVAAAETALGAQLGITSYAVKLIQWGQGEQDSQARNRPCGFPVPPFSTDTSPIPYLENLKDLVNCLAIPAPINASFMGSISGTVLTVASVSSGALHQYQLLTGAGVAPGTYVDEQISGDIGGAGAYQLKVYQAVSPETITGSGGTSCSDASISGNFFYAYPLSYSANAIVQSCVSGGAFAVGDTLVGAGVMAGTTITALDSAGHTADGLYLIAVRQTVASPGAPEPMTAAVGGFGTGADTAKFLMFKTFSHASANPTGVQIAQAYVNDHNVTQLSATTVNTDDALKATLTEIHYHAAWISELGRRLYRAYLGECDYHSPTC